MSKPVGKQRSMESAEREKTQSAEEEACEPSQRPQPVNPWNTNFQKVADLRSCQQLDDMEFPSLQRMPLRQERGKKKGKKQRIQKTPSTPSINFTFGLTLIPRAQKTKAEKAVETAVSTAKKNEAQSALKVEAETVVSSPASPKPLEAETVVCPASPKPLEAETDVSPSASPKTLEAETDVSLPASPKPLEAETVVSPPASPKPLEAKKVVSPPASPQPLEAETVVSPPASPVPRVETIESTAVSTETQSTEPSKVDLTSASGMQIDLTKDVILQVPELELHRIMDEKEMQEYLLEVENFAMIMEAEQLKAELADLTEEKMGLVVDLSVPAKTEWDATQKIQQLEEALNAATKKREEAETCLARQAEETSKVKTTLAQAQNNLEELQRQWEEDRSGLLAEHHQTTSSLEAAKIQAQEDLEKDSLQWHKEKSGLLQSLKSVRQALKKKREEIAKFMAEEMDRIVVLEYDVMVDEKPKRTKRKSVRKRFLQIFRRTGRT